MGWYLHKTLDRWKIRFYKEKFEHAFCLWVMFDFEWKIRLWKNYQMLMKSQTLLGDSERLRLWENYQTLKRNLFMTLKVLGSGKVKVIFCRLLTRLSALGNNVFFKGNDGFSFSKFPRPSKSLIRMFGYYFWYVKSYFSNHYKYQTHTTHSLSYTFKS